MKSQFYDQAGIGLLMLIMLTMALIASQAKPSIREVAPATNVLQLDAGLTVAIERERLVKLKSQSPVIATVLATPIKIELSFDETASPVSDIPEPEDLPVHND